MSEEKKHPLEKLFEDKIIPVTIYRKVICKKLIGGFECLGQKVVRPEQVDEIIDAHEKGGLFPDDGYIGVDEDFKAKQERWRKQRFGD